MQYLLIIFSLFSLGLSQTEYIFSDNIQVSNSLNNEEFPEMIINNNIIHLTWVTVYGNTKNIMYSNSQDLGENFSAPIQVNYLSNNIIAYGQSGSKIEVYNENIFITYIDDRSGSWLIYLNVSSDNGLTWEEEVVISDTAYLNGYQDFEIDNNGNLHLIYYNFASNNHLEDVRYRFAASDNNDWNFSPSIALGIVNAQMEPCDCCQPDLEIDNNGNVYVAYRNNVQNLRDTYLSVKRLDEDGFNENYQVSNFQDYIPYCPSSGPDIDIKENTIAVAYTIYDDDRVYTSISDLDEIDFSDFMNIYNSNSQQNYPYISLDENILIVWADYINSNSGNWEIYFAIRDLESNEMVNIQKINNDNGNHIQNDPILDKYNNDIFIFWSDKRNGNYDIYFSKGIGQSDLLGDINQDFLIDILDIISLVQVVLGNSNNFDNTDLNEDTIINIQDIMILINFIFNN
jgi:hypothetical protein